MRFLNIIVKNAENWHCPGTLLLHFKLLCYFLTKALKIEGIFVQHCLVISQFTSRVFVRNINPRYPVKFQNFPPLAGSEEATGARGVES